MNLADIGFEVALLLEEPQYRDLCRKGRGLFVGRCREGAQLRPVVGKIDFLLQRCQLSGARGFFWI